jgi:hypothetical protein
VSHNASAKLQELLEGKIALRVIGLPGAYSKGRPGRVEAVRMVDGGKIVEEALVGLTLLLGVLVVPGGDLSPVKGLAGVEVSPTTSVHGVQDGLPEGRLGTLQTTFLRMTEMPCSLTVDPSKEGIFAD